MTLPLAFSELENINGTNNNSTIENRQQARNRTFKRREPMTNTSKVQSVLDTIHNSNKDDDDEQGTFPPNPQSAGGERIDENLNTETNKKQEPMMNMASNEPMFRTLGKQPEPNYENGGNYDLNDYSNYGDDKSNAEYYSRMLPGYKRDPTNKAYYSHMNYKAPENVHGEDNILLQKMNYMITLLEDQQDERTNNVTEEVILYSFLGIFIIFIADTFVRAGKYVR